MKLLARLSCLAIAVLVAGRAVGSAVVAQGTIPGMAVSGQKDAAQESLDDVLWRAIEKPDALSADAAVDNGGASHESKKLARQEKTPRDGLLLLLLQILRSPK